MRPELLLEDIIYPHRKPEEAFLCDTHNIIIQMEKLNHIQLMFDNAIIYHIHMFPISIFPSG